MVQENPYKGSGGVFPQNNSNFIEFFRTIIESYNQMDLLIIDMALIAKESKEGLLDLVKNNNLIEIPKDHFKKVFLDSEKDENKEEE